MAIDLAGRIKHEAAKGVFQAIMKHAGYRVVGLGMETVVREVTPLTDAEYRALGLPAIVRRMPDFIVMDQAMKSRQLVEVKYAKAIDASLIKKIADRAGRFGELTLVLFYGRSSQNGSNNDFGEIVKCCNLRKVGDVVEASLKSGNGAPRWQPLSPSLAPTLWDDMFPLSASFTLESADAKLETAVENVFRTLAA